MEGMQNGSVACAYARDFAQLILRTVERLGQDGRWVPAGEALELTLAEHPDYVCVAQLRAKPARRIGLSTITERVRLAAFPHSLDGRKAGIRGTPRLLSHRPAQPGAPLPTRPTSCAEPSAVGARRRVAKAKTGFRRRAALTAAPPKSPW